MPSTGSCGPFWPRTWAEGRHDRIDRPVRTPERAASSSRNRPAWSQACRSPAGCSSFWIPVSAGRNPPRRDRRSPLRLRLAFLSGRAGAILTAERVALNLLQRMCGIATATRAFVDAVAGTRCRILDTRKTAPGLRPFDRQAVRDGGGVNHRYDLSEMVLIKDNHRRLAGGVARAVAAARAGAPGVEVEVEVESEAELAGGARRWSRPHPDRQPDSRDRGPLVRDRPRGRRGRPSSRPPATCASRRCAPTRSRESTPCRSGP